MCERVTLEIRPGKKRAVESGEERCALSFRFDGSLFFSLRFKWNPMQPVTFFFIEKNED